MDNDTLTDLVFGPETFIDPDGDYDHDVDADPETVSADIALLNTLLFFNLRSCITTWGDR